VSRLSSDVIVGGDDDIPDANTPYHPDQVPDSDIKDKENPHTELSSVRLANEKDRHEKEAEENHA
jgi:hypothetical protein